MRRLSVVLLASCAATPTPTPAPPKSTIVVTPIHEPASTAAPASDAPAPAPAPTKPARVVSFLRTTSLPAAPFPASARIGVIRAGTRAAVHDSVITNECTWIEISPRGWTCESAVELTSSPPTTADDLPDDTHPIRGVYGFVRGGSEAYATAADARDRTNGRALAGNNTVRAAGPT